MEKIGVRKIVGGDGRTALIRTDEPGWMDKVNDFLEKSLGGSMSEEFKMDEDKYLNATLKE